MPAPLKPTGTPGIYKRGSKYAVRFTDPTGKVRQRSASTLAEARRLRSELTADVARGEYRAASKIRFADYAATWVATYKGRTSRGIQPETVREYAQELDRFAIPFFGRRMLAEIEPRDVKAFAASLEARGLKPNTVRLAVAPLRALLATAVEEGLIRHNPASGVRLATRTTVDVDDDQDDDAKAINEDELRALIAAVPGAHRPFVAFVAATGTRISEAVAVRWGDIDFGTGRLSIRRRWRLGRYAPPKSKYGKRTIPLPPAMARDLWERRKSASDPRDDALIWPSRNGTPLDAANLLTRVLRPAARAAGVGWAGWHTLRHTAGSLLFRHGANAKQVQVFLGHHSPAFTLATYVHLLPEDAPDVAFFDRIRDDVPLAQRDGAIYSASGGQE